MPRRRSGATGSSWGATRTPPPAVGGLTAKQICEDGLGSYRPTVFGGSGKLTVPAWIGADVCTSGGEHPIGNLTAASPITVHIEGLLYGSNGPNEIVGSSTSPGPIARFWARGGCWDKHYNSGTVPFPGCDTYGNGGATSGARDGVFASTWAPASQPVTPPTLIARGGGRSVQQRVARPKECVRRRLDRHRPAEPVRQ